MINPEESELFEAYGEVLKAEIFVSLIGHVVRVDHTKNTCVVRPMVQEDLHDLDGERVAEDLPLLENVRVGWVRAGGIAFVLPLTAGDPVRVVFADRYSGNYRATGAKSPPGLSERHGLSSGVAWPCDERDSSLVPASAFQAGWAVLHGGGLRVGGTGATATADAEKVMGELGEIASLLSGLGLTYVPSDVAHTKLKAE